ncbi:hypothetical protein F5X98DRAFT_329850 [Xylaria grammica]|nr:hypothetical protein F5X98DRAFT_329850 [Xylaria grammica]
MTPLQRLALLSLSGVVCSQDAVFVEFLAPQKNEVVAAGTTYVIKWAPKSSTGSGTMSLLAGQTPDSLNKIGEIAYFIDVTSGNFSWPVPFSAPAHPSSLYALNFSLDGSESTFDTSPSFKIAFQGIPDSDDDTDDGKDVANSSTSKRSHRNRNRSIIVNNNNNQGSDASSYSSSYSSSDSSSDSSPKLSNNAIVGIVIGAAAALAIFSSLVWLIFYYRRKSLEKVQYCVKGTCYPEQPCSKGSCRSNVVDVECSQIRAAPAYELNATREIQEAGGEMKPAELGSTVTKPESSAADIGRNIKYR